MKKISQYVALAALGIVTAGLPVSIAHAADAPKVEYHGISDKDVQKEVPKAVLKTMDEFTKDSKDPFYQRQLRDGKTFYSVHYTKADKRMFVRVDDKGKLVAGPGESQTTVRNKANPDFGKTPEEKAAVKREVINGELLPLPVRKTIEQNMANGGGHVFTKETRGSEVTYLVDYTVGEQATSARVAADGKLLEASPLQNVDPTKAAALTAAQLEAQAASAKEAAEREAAAAAQAAGVAAASNAPYEVLGSPNQLPAEVRTAVEKAAPGGSSDLLLQRFKKDGKNLYGVHYSTPDGKREFMAVDQTGKVVVEPKKSKAQEGGKGVKFEVLSGDKLPPEILKAVQTNGGTDHLIVARTQPDGDKTYLVQYTDAKGERMETRFGVKGKELGKPREAREQPFTMLSKKGD